MSGLSSVENVPIQLNSDKSCTFPSLTASLTWSNFNEGCDLVPAVEDYLRKFGYYPTAVLADKIYQTRENKLYCKERGIRLSGLPLGRRKASETDAKINQQMYRDACERNIIEGRNGNAKRRFGLDRICSKLDETAKTEALLILLAMNACRRLAHWLALFFRFLLFPLGYLCFSADPNYVIKYITKSDCKIFGKWYLSSRGLKKGPELIPLEPIRYDTFRDQEKLKVHIQNENQIYPDGPFMIIEEFPPLKDTT